MLPIVALSLSFAGDELLEPIPGSSILRVNRRACLRHCLSLGQRLQPGHRLHLEHRLCLGQRLPDKEQLQLG